MTELTLADIAERLRDIDFAMLLTHSDNGEIAGRPMSNNGEVAYDGDSYYFSWESARTVSDIAANPKVALSFQGAKSLLGKPGLMVAVEGRGEIVRDKSRFAEHWTPDLDRWFEQGIDTPGVVMIKVHAERIHYWDGEDEGEIKV